MWLFFGGGGLAYGARMRLSLPLYSFLLALFFSNLSLSARVHLFLLEIRGNACSSQLFRTNMDPQS